MVESISNKINSKISIGIDFGYSHLYAATYLDEKFTILVERMPLCLALVRKNGETEVYVGKEALKYEFEHDNAIFITDIKHKLKLN